MKKILEIAKLLFPFFIERHQSELDKNTGLLLVVSELQFPKNTFDVFLGENTPETLDERKKSARKEIDDFRTEKAVNLTSITTDSEQPSVAIRTKNFYFSANGFPRQASEEFLVLLGLLTKELDEEAAFGIMEASLKRRTSHGGKS